MSRRANQPNNSRSRRPGTSNYLPRIEQQQLDALTKILSLQKTQQQQSIESVPDVPKMVLKRDKVYTFSRVMTLADASVNPNFQVSNAFTVQLSQLAGGSEIAVLFEQYRIVQMTFHFTPTLSLGSGAVQHVPIYTWIDQDDDTVPSAPGYQSQTLRVTPQGHYLERTLVPQIAQDGLSSTTTLTGYSSPSNATWIDCDSPNVKYYGLKYFIPQAAQQTESVVFSIRATVIVQARRPI